MRERRRRRRKKRRKKRERRRKSMIRVHNTRQQQARNWQQHQSKKGDRTNQKQLFLDHQTSPSQEQSSPSSHT
ncbi:hypothetical protein OYC64_009178 [Pagothenia borchgrevinki]|uniref:Uncharacterized protein n=1 Tax=Pagothenia borchgrevinki TaxID=8213 RepID=A0ABD2H3L3_PAGBO